MKKKFCDSITEGAAYKNVGGIVEAQIDSGPSDQSCDDEEDPSIFWKPCGQKGRHHKCTEGVSTGKARVKNFSLAFGKLSDHFQKHQWSLTVDEKFNAVNDCELNGIKEKEMEKRSIPLYAGMGKERFYQVPEGKS